MGHARLKGMIVSLCLLGAISVFLSHTRGAIWPWIPGAMLLGAASIVWLGIRSVDLRHWLAVVCGGAIAVRVGIFLSPATMIGYDPGRYAVAILRVIEAGSIGAIESGTPLYAVISLFHHLNAVSALVLDVTGREVLIAIPVAFGIILPLTAATISRRLTPTHHRLVAGTTATVAAVLAIGVQFSYMPIVQSLAVLLWCGLFFVLQRYLTTRDWRFLVAAGIITSASLFAHKTSIFIPVLGIITAALVWWIYPNWFSKQPTLLKRDGWALICILAGTGLFLQWEYITNYLYTFILGVVLPFIFSGTEIGGVIVQAPAASLHLNGVVGILYRNSGWMLLLGMTAVAWLFAWLQRTELRQGMTIVLGTTAILGALTAATVVGGSVATPHRIQLYALPVAVPLIFVTIVQVGEWKSLEYRRVTTNIIAIAVVLIALQFASGGLAPDYRDTPRTYLTVQEVEGKNFANETLRENSTIATDYFYATKQTTITSEGVYDLGEAASGQFQDASSRYLNGTLASGDHEAVLVRTSVENYRFRPGWYRLEYSPITHLEEAGYHRTYENGEVVLYNTPDKATSKYPPRIEE